VLARMVPIYDRVEERWNWHPLTKWLIDHFGNQEEVLSALTSNMGSFGWSGSKVPYLLKQIEVMEQLRCHRIPEVRAWVSRRLSYLKEELERERIRDEETGYGIYE
jgi:hypothetical protein